MHSMARMFGRSAMVVREVSIDDESEEQVRIVARKAGLISWILSLLGIDSTYTLRVYADRIESVEGSLSGRIKTVVPMSAVDTYTSGFTKPIQNFVIAVIFWIGATFAMIGGRGLGTVSIILYAISIGSVIAYFLNKSLLLAFTTCGGNGIFFLFKRSVIEGVNVDETLAESVMEIVKRDYIAQVVR